MPKIKNKVLNIEIKITNKIYKILKNKFAGKNNKYYLNF